RRLAAFLVAGDDANRGGQGLVLFLSADSGRFNGWREVWWLACGQVVVLCLLDDGRLAGDGQGVGEVLDLGWARRAGVWWLVPVDGGGQGWVMVWAVVGDAGPPPSDGIEER
ncbi:hypothetical protein Dimus_021270, partial [Dionaea muscipula]